MAKLRFAVMAVFLALILAACGSGKVMQESYITSEESMEESKANDKTIEKANNEAAETAPLTRQELFLEDLDYMLYVLENNFALFDVAHWAHGADIPAIFEDLRAIVLNNPNMDVDEFHRALNQNFSPLVGAAHFDIVGANFHYKELNDPNAWGLAVFTRESLARWNLPHVLEFYEPRYQTAPPDINERAQAMLELGNGLLSKWVIDIIALLGERDLANEITLAMANENFEEAKSLIVKAIKIMDNTPNVTTGIIEDGRIAYLSVDSFLPFSHEERNSDKEKILSFYEGIQDFDHLIIDLRRNGGGDAFIFYETIMGPIINERFRASGYAFAVSGEYSEEFLRTVPIGRAFNYVSLNTPIDGRLREVSELLNEFDLPELNMADMERMDYGFLFQSPPIRPMYHERFGGQPAFNGKVWLLTGPHMGSATQLSAWVSMESGFATHVGETTGGTMGGPRTTVALPNSGILFIFDIYYLTDERGRPLEAGTVPHYFNREGMDALETTLALIAEGE